MKLTFFGNVLDYHQEGLAKAFYNILGDDYHFVAFSDLPNHRKEAGFKNLADEYPFVVKAYTPEGKEKTEELINNSDVVIIGAAPNDVIEKCVSKGIETYLFSERFFKMGTWRAFVPPIRKKVVQRAARFRQPNFKLLCASAYLPYDMALCGWYGKAYKWGYFPDVVKYDIDELMSKKATGDKPVNILWVGRLIDWKHPEESLWVAKYLKEKNLPFHMNIIGYGELESFIKDEIKNNQLDDYITFMGKKTVPEVREAMENADIFLMTSDYNEGWGVVVNESLNSACVVIANYAAGSVPYMIVEGKTGLIYKNNNIKTMFPIIEKLITDESYRKEIQKNAYYHMVNNASPEVVASRFVALYERNAEFSKGVCSIAPIIKSAKKIVLESEND